MRENLHQRRSLLTGVAVVFGLAALVFAVFRPALQYGRLMDDHAHYRQLRAAAWSLRSLTDACRLELVGGVLETWFLPECTLRFFRPLAFGLMKLTYTLFDWDAHAMHGASLAWHALVCVLLFALLRQAGAARLLAFCVAALFAVHPGQLAPVQWLACQTELMVTAFLLGATLAWLNFRERLATRQPRAGLFAALCLLCYAAALGCRENAIMLPAILLAFEPILARRRGRPVLLLYLGLLVLAAAYLALRAFYLGGAAVPPRPYVYTPQDPGFLRFLFDKAAYYLLGEFFMAPIVPFGGLLYLRERPALFYGLLVAVLVLLGVAVRVAGWRRGLPAIAWLLGFMLPILPTFASPHHLYLPGIGWALIAMYLFTGLGGRRLESRSPAAPLNRPDGLASEKASAAPPGAAARRPADFEAGANWRRRWSVGPAGQPPLRRGLLMYAAALALGGVFTITCLSFSLALETGEHIESRVAAEIVATADELHDGDTLYVANLPILAHYTRLLVEEQTGLKNLRVIMLTWAPRTTGLVGTDLRSELTWVNDRTIELRIAGDRYFGGTFGHLVSEATALSLPTQTWKSAEEHGFHAEVLAHDSDGVTALRFTFERPLSDPQVHLYWGSPVRWAAKLRPER